MTSCIVAFYIAGSCAAAAPPALDVPRIVIAEAGRGPAAAMVQAMDPDALYAARENLSNAREAERIWTERLRRDPRAFEAAWRLARARYYLGRHGPQPERRAFLEAGIAAGRTAAAIEPKRPEGHFWIAANMGALAESFGLRQGLKYRGDIKDALLTVLKLDPAFQGGSADRALGRWYHKVPALFGGSRRKAEEHLRRSLTYAPESTASRFFLAELLMDTGRHDEARRELERVVAAPVHPDWAPEDRAFKKRAAELIQSRK